MQLLTLRRLKDDKIFLLTFLVVAKIKRTSLVLAEVVVSSRGIIDRRMGHALTRLSNLCSL